jgi:fused signal recognition particle receptor
MVVIIVLVVVVAVLLLGTTAFVVSARRGRIGTTTPPEVAPAPPRPARRPQQPPSPSPAATTAEEAPEVAVPDDLSSLAELAEAPPVEIEEAPLPAGPETVAAPPKFRDRLGRARNLFSGYLTSVRARDRIDEATWEDLEEALILADVGAITTASILDDLRARVKADGIAGPDDLVAALRRELTSILEGDRELHMGGEGTTVWLFVGVNGVGKTTTIGKLGARQAQAGHKVVMAAGDTFRAAAADQLEMWSQRVGASIIRGNEGGDPGAVVFDAVQHASARGADLVLADTAGRLHTKTNLMEELKKVRRVAERPPGNVTEVLLVIDATTGQNGLIQARQFAEAVGVTGVVLTKLDGTAKGGIVIAIRSELGIPIKLVGLGEGPEDLVSFDPAEFVDALVGTD